MNNTITIKEFLHLEEEEQKNIILNIMKKLDNKKQIRVKELMELSTLLNFYDNDLLNGFISDGCIDLVYQVEHYKDKVFLMDNDGQYFCRKSFRTNKECYKYIKELVNKNIL